MTVIAGNLPQTSTVGIALAPLGAIAVIVDLVSPFTTLALFSLSLYALRRMTLRQTAVAAIACLRALLGTGYWCVRLFLGLPAM